jgi:2-polyprenyl-3-methyl-5-hydroxy-6-metoxy-1,4-benzoquinol methylase
MTDPAFDAHDAWNKLATGYERSRTRPGSIDSIMEFPAQLEFLGDVAGLRILDVGCGSGAKARELSERGAVEVVGIDISDAFIDAAKEASLPEGVSFVRGDFNRLDEIEGLRVRLFDLVVCFQVMGFASEPGAVLRSMASLLAPRGRIVIQTPSPIRFAIDKAERFGLPLSAAYRMSPMISYRSGWNPDVVLEHRTPMISDTLNAFATAGLYVARCWEPDLSVEARAEFPETATWFDKYGGVVLYELRRLGEA